MANINSADNSEIKSVNEKIITFVIPCYNSADYMSKAIESCIVAGPDVEVIMVDDGSTKDNTFEIAQEYERKYPGICRAIHQENKGHGGACNTGIANAKGKYVKVVDSDDWLDKPALKEVMNRLRSFDTIYPDLFIVNFVYENQAKYHKKRLHFENVFPVNRIFTWNDIGRFLVDQYILMHSVIYKTKVLHDCQLKMPEHMFYVDNIFVFNPMPYVKTMYYDNVNLYRYFIGRDDQSVNESVMISRIDQQIWLCKDMTCTFLKTSVKYPKCRKYMLKYLSIMYYVASILLIVSGTKEHLSKKKKLWEWLKETDLSLYKRIRFSPIGFALNMPGNASRALLKKGYHGLAKYIGFN